MTPLIDVIFLLLLFFMLTSTFTRFADVPLAQAGGRGGAPGERPPLFLQVSAEGLRLNGRDLAEADLDAALKPELAGGARQALLALVGPVTSQDFIRSLVALQRIEGLSVQVLR